MAVKFTSACLQHAASCAYGNLPVMDEVKQEAARRHVELILLPTAKGIKELKKASRHTNAVLHITC